MPERLHVRRFRDSDLAAVLDLWERETPWGRPSAEQWRQWVTDTPHGPCVVMIAAGPDDEVLGQIIFTPAVVAVDGRAVRAVRMVAPILRREIRGTGLRDGTHPILGLYDGSVEVLLQCGYGLVYALPDHAWLPVFALGARTGIRTQRFASTTFDCMVLPFDRAPDASSDVSPDVAGSTVQPATATGDEYDALWRSAEAALPIACGVVRSGAWHRFKHDARHVALEMRDGGDGRLVAYAVVARNGTQLTDMLVDDASRIPAMLAATHRWLSAHRADVQVPGTEPLRTFKVMATALLRPALSSLGFTVVDYRFAFTCCPLDPALPADAVEPGRWYIMPGD